MRGMYDYDVTNPVVEQNPFIGRSPEDTPLLSFEEARPLLPAPFWEGHDSAIACWWRVWELVWSKSLKRPTPENGYISNYIDTCFGNCLFMWDSVFILMFARYARRAFNAQRTLDNLYAKQHADGFISRQVQNDDGEDHFDKYSPVSTGPDIMGWCEWEYFLNSGDRDRLADVFGPLLAYHQWMRWYRTWQDGTYWTSGLGCGMDNQPRQPELSLPHQDHMSHGHMSWIDATCQAVLSAQVLLDMAAVLGRTDEVDELRAEIDRLSSAVNETMWDEGAGFYFDRFADGSRSDVWTIGAYWAVLAGLAPEARQDRLVAHLDDPATFNRPHRVPTLAANHPKYRAEGGYWLGSVWPPTNYMVLRALTKAGRDALAHEIGMNHVANTTKVFEDTNTVWENYAPESAAPGKPARGDFVGWGGVGPVAVLMEYVFGLRPAAQDRRLVWDVRLLEAHGVERYPFGNDGLVDLRCAARAAATDKPDIQASASVPLTLEVRWEGGSEELSLG